MVTKVLDPPKPGKNAQDYDEKRLREGLKYADSNTQTQLSAVLSASSPLSACVQFSSTKMLWQICWILKRMWTRNKTKMSE
jgi:hypothetical protein